MDATGTADNTSNAPIGGDPFSDLKKALTENVREADLRARLLASVDDMRALQGQSEFAAAYQRFVALSAGHVGLVAPYFAKFAAMIDSPA
jgi:hypothetical protein